MPVDMPPGEYDLIYADPPWSYRDDGNPNGGVAQQYETMDIEDICDLDVPAADDCILYLWGTVTHVPEAMDVIDAWGFEYKTQFVWDKQRLGVGYWARGEHELLYVATRGDVSPPPTDDRRGSIFREPAREHSAKPKVVRGYIEDAHPDAEKLELFARDNRSGWSEFGNEVPENTQTTLADGYD